MLDPQLLRNSTEEVATVLLRRGYVLDVERFKTLEKDRKQLQIKQQELQHFRNENSKQIGQLKAIKQDPMELIKKTELIGEELKSVDNHLQKIQVELSDLTAVYQISPMRPCREASQRMITRNKDVGVSERIIRLKYLIMFSLANV